MQTGTPEERKRFRPALQVRVTYTAGAARARGRVATLSRYGMFLESPMLPTEGERVVIAIQPSLGHRIEVEGTVRWNTGRSLPSGFGVWLSRSGRDYSEFYETLRGRGPAAAR